MEQFYYERPSVERKNEIIEYMNEHAENKSNINGTGSLDRILEGVPFEEVLERCLGMEDPEYAKSHERCPGKTFLLIRSSDNKIVGTINIRWDLNEAMLKHGGHIGYGIRPTERRKGYNKINLYLGLLEAKKQGLDRVMLSCDEANLGSEKTILALGGEFERREIDPYDGEQIKIYWINVEDSINKYKDVYEPYLFCGKTK